MFQPSRAVAALAQQRNSFERQDAPRATAIGDDFLIWRQLGQAPLQLG